MYGYAVKAFCIAASFIISCSGHKIVRTLTVQNGGNGGTWSDPMFCPDKSFVYSAKMKAEPEQIEGYGNILTGIIFKCRNMKGGYVGTVESLASNGRWMSAHKCHRRRQYFVAFRLYTRPVDSGQGFDSDTVTAGTYDVHADHIRFLCAAEGHKYIRLGVGDDQPWSESCPKHSMICGLSVKTEPSEDKKNGTVINDMRFYCCEQLNAPQMGAVDIWSGADVNRYRIIVALMSFVSFRLCL